MPLSLPGPYNVYIPNAKASGNLFVDFSRNINDFAVLKYCQPVPVQNTLGIWYQMGLDERARITDTDLAKYEWPDGEYRPKPRDVAEYFQEKQFRTHRRTYPDVVGKMTSEQAVWDEINRRTRSLAQKGMTARTIKVINTLTTQANWPTGHYFDLSSPGAITGVTGNWAGSTAARQTIKRTINAIKNQINLDTRAAVDTDDLVIVMGPDTAQLVSVTQEIVELVKQSVFAGAYLNLNENNRTFPKDLYGLPPQLYGHDVIIEKTVYVSTPRNEGGSQTAQYVIPKGTILFLFRPGELEGQEGGRSFSTVTMHLYRDDDMKVETNYESFHRLTELAVTDNYDVNMTAPITGACVINAV